MRTPGAVRPHEKKNDHDKDADPKGRPSDPARARAPVGSSPAAGQADLRRPCSRICASLSHSGNAAKTSRATAQRDAPFLAGCRDRSGPSGLLFADCGSRRSSVAAQPSQGSAAICPTTDARSAGSDCDARAAANALDLQSSQPIKVPEIVVLVIDPCRPSAAPGEKYF